MCLLVTFQINIITDKSSALTDKTAYNVTEYLNANNILLLNIFLVLKVKQLFSYNDGFNWCSLAVLNIRKFVITTMLFYFLNISGKQTETLDTCCLHTKTTFTKSSTVYCISCAMNKETLILHTIRKHNYMQWKRKTKLFNVFMHYHCDEIKLTTMDKRISV